MFNLFNIKKILDQNHNVGFKQHAFNFKRFAESKSMKNINEQSKFLLIK